LSLHFNFLLLIHVQIMADNNNLIHYTNDLKQMKSYLYKCHFLEYFQLALILNTSMIKFIKVYKDKIQVIVFH